MTKCLGVLVLALATAVCAAGSSHAGNPAPTSWRWVGTHGIEVAVPAGWRLNRGVCGTPKANTALWNEDGVFDCLTGQPRGLSVVEFGSFIRRPRGWYERRTTRVLIDGALARRWRAGAVAGSPAVHLAFPRRGISVTVLSPHPSLLHRILASIRTVRVDVNGCPTRPHPVYRRGRRPRVSQPFVPQGAARMVGCSYHGRWLDTSNRIGPRAATRLARALDAAPSGFSHAHRGSTLPSACRPSWRDSLIVVRFEYADRPPVSVAAHLDGCSALGASNGRWAVRLRPPWVHRLVSDAHYLGAFIEYGE